jgi:hypothetical protein
LIVWDAALTSSVSNLSSRASANGFYPLRLSAVEISDRRRQVVVEVQGSNHSDIDLSVGVRGIGSMPVFINICGKGSMA